MFVTVVVPIAIPFGDGFKYIPIGECFEATTGEHMPHSFHIDVPDKVFGMDGGNSSSCIIPKRFFEVSKLSDEEIHARRALAKRLIGELTAEMRPEPEPQEP